MRIYQPDNVSLLGYVWAQYGGCLQEPMVIPSLAREWHDQSGTSVDGRYQKHSGETHAVGVAKRQATLLDTTTGLVGAKFHVVSGSWNDDFYHDVYHTSCLGVPNGAPSTTSGAVNEIVSVDAPQDLEHSEIWLQWGDPPVSTDGNDYSHDRAKRYTYITLGYQSPDNIAYRVRFEYGQPIALDVSYDGGSNWDLGVAVLKDIGNFETYIKHHNNEITLKVIPDISYRIVGVEVGDGHMLTHTVDPTRLNPKKNITSFANSDHALPRNGKIRLQHRNGVLKFAYFPQRFGQLNISKSLIDLGSKLQDSSDVTVIANAIGTTPAGQSDTITPIVQGTKVGWKSQSTLPDAGDGLGSLLPPVFNDASIIIAPKWGNAPKGTPEGFGQQIARADSYWVQELQRWSHVSRTLTTDATLLVENGDGRWDGTFGNLALNITGSNDGGASYYQRLQGIVNGNDKGIQFIRKDPERYMQLLATCRRAQMQVPLNQRCIFDHWAWPSVVRFLANKAGVHPAFLESIPLYIPPGATADAPYGKAGYDCPYYILPSGFGTKAFFEYGPEAIIWDILQFLVQFLNSGYDNAGNRYTWYMGWTNDGQYHFEGVELYNLPLAMSYSTVDPSGIGLIEGELRVINDVGDLRTSIDFEGLDANSYELIFEHRELPWQVQLVKGYREAWFERSAAFCSAEFTKFSANEAEWQCSIPTQGVVFQAKFLPFVNAGALISVTDDSIEGGTGFYSIEYLLSRYGLVKPSGQECSSIIVARSLAATY